MQSSKPRASILDLLGGALDVAERFEKLGPIGAGSLAWQALPQATKEKVLGECCADCGQPRSLCECCDACGWTPCACPHNFPRETIEAEGVTVE